MQSSTCEFRTLLTENEYKRLLSKFPNAAVDIQTNHYFDTSRFTLRATDASLRVRERDTLTLTYKRSKGYIVQNITNDITNDDFKDLLETKKLKPSDIANEVNRIIGTQNLENYMSISTHRSATKYGNGLIFIDKTSYLGTVDYELEYESKNSYDGKKEFIAILSEYRIKYKKTDKKIKRAFQALKNAE